MDVRLRVRPGIGACINDMLSPSTSDDMSSIEADILDGDTSGNRTAKHSMDSPDDMIHILHGWNKNRY